MVRYVGIRTSYVVPDQTLSRGPEEQLRDHSEPVRVFHTAQLAGGVHGELRHTDIAASEATCPTGPLHWW